MDSQIKKAMHHIGIAEGLLDVSYPLIKEGKIILKSLEEIGKSAEILLKLNPENEELKEILGLVNRRKTSPMEFSRKNKAVIMHEDLNLESITPELLREKITFIKKAIKIDLISEKIA